jgi:hypothetical protein
LTLEEGIAKSKREENKPFLVLNVHWPRKNPLVLYHILVHPCNDEQSSKTVFGN